MDDSADAAFAAFVTDRRPALLRTALLLTGNRGAAEELVQRALTRARRSWPRDPETAVLRGLVAGAPGRWTRLTRAEQVIESLPEPSAAPAGADLADALRDLAPRTRAVVVLRHADHLSATRVAGLLRCPVGTVQAEEARGLAQLRPAVAAGGYERAAPEVPAEQRLAAQLSRLAEAPGHWRLAPGEAVSDVHARRSGARRRLLVGALAALGVLVVAVPLARWAPDPPRSSSATAPSSVATASPPPIAPRSVPVLTGPPRGSLAGDATVVDALRTVDWGAQEAPPPDQRTVVFAADTPNGRVALVVGTVLEDFRGTWLTGPAGAAPTDLVPHLPRRLGEARPLALLVGGPGDATLVVVAAPGDRIAVSDRLMTGPRGTVGRSYAPVDTVDGVAVVPSRTTSLGPALSVRVVREGREVYRSAVDWLGTPAARAAVAPRLTPLRPGAGAPDPDVVDAAITDLAVPLGVEPAALQPELLWSAERTAGDGPGSVVVLVAHSPGGALVVTTWAGGGGVAVPCGTQTPPGTTDVAGLTIARTCDGPQPDPGGTGDGHWLVVTVPAGAASAELLGARGRVLGRLALTDGSAVVALPQGARSVRTLDADGQLIAETAIAPAPTEVFGDFGDGPAR